MTIAELEQERARLEHFLRTAKLDFSSHVRYEATLKERIRARNRIWTIGTELGRAEKQLQRQH